MLANPNNFNEADNSANRSLISKHLFRKKFATALLSALCFVGTATAYAETYQVVYHIVEKGDTLTKLSKKFNVPVDEMKKLNQLKSDTINTEDRLLIPINKVSIKQSTNKPANKSTKKTTKKTNNKTSKKTNSKNSNKTTKQTKNSKTKLDGKKYQAKSGDTLSGIASKHRITLASLLDANNINRDYPLKAGDILVLPKGSSSQPDSKENNKKDSKKTTTANKNKQTTSKKTQKKLKKGQMTYTIQSGDTLESIAKKFSMSQAELESINDIQNINLLKAGEKLTVNKVTPKTKQTDKAKKIKRDVNKKQEKTQTTVKKQSNKAKQTSKNNVVTYVVQSGDNLTTIANLFSVSRQLLIESNQLENNDYLVVGQVLQIPKSAKSKADQPVSKGKIKDTVNKAVRSATY